MTLLMEEALQRLRAVPQDRQDALARMVLLLAESETGDDLTDDDVRAIEISRAQAETGDFATDREMRDLWAKYGL